MNISICDTGFFEGIAECVIVPCHINGVMPNGIAAQIKDFYPKNYLAWNHVRNDGAFGWNYPFLYRPYAPEDRRTWAKRHPAPYFFLNVAVKNLDKHPVLRQYIRLAMNHIKTIVRKNKITSIAMPPIGLSEPNFSFSDLYNITTSYLLNEDVTVLLYKSL